MAFLATLEYRTSTLQKLQRTRPQLVSIYALSCWMYSVTGVWYLCVLPKLQPGQQTTALMSGHAFGLLLILQGASSYANDALVTLGKHVYPGRLFWTIADRCLAWLLMITTVANVFTWPACGLFAQRVSVTLVVVCVFSYPSSKFCEIRGWMEPFLVCHSIWHYVPNILAIIWIGMCAFGL